MSTGPAGRWRALQRRYGPAGSQVVYRGGAQASQVSAFPVALANRPLALALKIPALRGAILTRRQDELLLHCYQRGYYDIPRQANLLLLAKGLGISPASLSMVLRRAEARIVDAYAHRDGPAGGRKPGAKASASLAPVPVST
jgi:hypothetical protein